MISGSKKKAAFQKAVWGYYHDHRRDALPWRMKKNLDPYKIWVSEIMLQQTQVDRVIAFFNNWMKLFPNITALANASQVDVLRAWKGLGYNSRALRMKKTAEIILAKHGGKFPKNYEDILALPGIGPYTAGAISAFAYNQPVTMIETNIRRVYLHHFFKDQENIHDKDLLEVISKTFPKSLDKLGAGPREWYWALMDYGSHLGKTIPNPNKKSRHYTIQKPFKGSGREIRGAVLALLLKNKTLSFEKLFTELKTISDDQDRIESIIDRMNGEGFVVIKGDIIKLKK